MLRIIASAGYGLFSFINIDDLKRPWTPKEKFWAIFLAIFGCNAHFKSELRRNGWR